MSVKLDESYLNKFVSEQEVNEIAPMLKASHLILENATGAGNDFLGWLNLPNNYNKEEFEEIKKAADKIKNDSDVLIVIGIGGSYLGARAVIEAIKSQNYNLMDKNTPNIYFVGNSLSPNHLNDIIKLCEGKDISINVISKSGTTTEPAVAFRIFKKIIEEKYGKEKAKERIYVTTDKEKGKLKEFSIKNGYKQFIVPDDVGGRFSVLTAVGLLPIAVSGIDIDKLMKGAQSACENYKEYSLKDNDCYRYAALRNILMNKGREIEILASYEPKMALMTEWYKQLFGESEGKNQKGIYPSSAIFSTDLHSMGQFIQDGKKIIFETLIDIENSNSDIFIEKEEDDFDSLNFLAKKNMSEINKSAMQGTILAHTEGNTPNIVIKLDKIDEENIGELIYFFEKACAISGYLLGVNPFDQPGVESYKTNMFAILNKPGYEDKREQIMNKIKNI